MGRCVRNYSDTCTCRFCDRDREKARVASEGVQSVIENEEASDER